jgi:hypothetical protein
MPQEDVVEIKAARSLQSERTEDTVFILWERGRNHMLDTAHVRATWLASLVLRKIGGQQSRLATTRQELFLLLLSRCFGQSFTICAIFNSQEIGTGTSRVVRATGPLAPARYVLSQTQVYDLQEVAQDAVGPEMIAMVNGKNIQVVAETGVCINLLAFLKSHVPLPIRVPPPRW